MSSVRYCCSTNSTLFTTCCGYAICDDQSKCPACGVDVTPRSSEERHSVAMIELYGADKVRKIWNEWAGKNLER